MTKPARPEPKAEPRELSPEELNAKIALTGDLADLSPGQQMIYYERYCKHLGLDPITRPFDLLTTYDENGKPKTTLYANASCSAQLANARQITYGKPELEYNEKLGILTINVQAMTSAGNIGMIRSCWRRGVADIQGLKGKRLENAIKKAETQAHRRATLALCGVAMPDESEIEDIPGAQLSKIEPAKHVSPEQMPTAKEIFHDPRPVPTEPALPAAWQDGSIANQIADQAIAEAIAQELKAPATAPKAVQIPKDSLKVGDVVSIPSPVIVAPDVKVEIKTADPVPLQVTVSPAQQKVLETIRTATTEHGRAKDEVWNLIYAMLGRKIRRAAELTEEEAEKVFAYLQTLCSKWSDEAKPEPAPVKYDRKAPRHNAELAEAIGEAIKKLTLHGVPFGPISDAIAELTEREFGRKIANRYDLTDEEAQSALEYLQNRILEKECETAVAADEV